MVRVENNKLIIEIETDCPEEDLVNYKSSILDAIKYYNYAEFGGENLFWIINLMQELELDIDQTKKAVHTDEEVFVFPSNTTNAQRQLIRHALLKIEHPELDNSNPPIYRELLKAGQTN